MMKWIAAFLILTSVSFARASGEKVCGTVLPCRNFNGDVSGGRNYHQRVIISKLDDSAVLVNLVILYYDTGRESATMTWDFLDDNGKFKPDGRFMIYSAIPDLTGTNRIGDGQCRKGVCSYAYTLKEFKEGVKGAFTFLPDGTLKYDLSEKSGTERESVSGTLHPDEN